MAKNRNYSSETTSSGCKANRTGNVLEKFVEAQLKAQGYDRHWNHKNQLFGLRKAAGGKQYGKQIICGKTIYETDRMVDFLVLNEARFPASLIIECKWQQVRGSVDEKYPFLFFNIMKTGVPTVVLIDGDGYRSAALKFLKDQASETSSLIGAWTMAEFQTQVNNGFLG